MPDGVQRLLRVNRDMNIVGVLAPALPKSLLPQDVPVEVEVAVRLALVA